MAGTSKELLRYFIESIPEITKDDIRLFIYNVFYKLRFTRRNNAEIAIHRYDQYRYGVFCAINSVTYFLSFRGEGEVEINNTSEEMIDSRFPEAIFKIDPDSRRIRQIVSSLDMGIYEWLTVRNTHLGASKADKNVIQSYFKQ